MEAHTRLVISARDRGAVPTMAPSAGLGVTSCAMPPRTAVDASAPAAPVRRGDGVVAGRAGLALACLAWAIRDLLVREAAAGGTQVCAGHGTRPTSPHAGGGGAAGCASDAYREHSTKARPQRQGGDTHRPLG